MSDARGGGAQGRGGAPSGAGGSPAEGAPVLGLAHVAIATRDADGLATTLAAGLGARRGREEMLDGGTLRVLFLHLGPVTLELIEPRSAEHTVARFLDQRGPGIHHVSLEVGDLDAALARCGAAGIERIDRTPRAGAHGTRVAFLHPKSLGGVLIELCERKAPPRSNR